MNAPKRFCYAGFTLIEILITMVIGSVLILGVSNVMSRTLQASSVGHVHNDLTRQSRFAMQQMVHAVSRSDLLQFPLLDDPLTPLQENVREQFYPSVSSGDNGFASAVLTVNLSPLADLDGNGSPDADNDSDGLVDEDLEGDTNSDSCSGICLVDDNGDGNVDNGMASDDDEDGASDEDWYDPVIFYLSEDNLIQRTPVPWDTNSSGDITSADYVEEVIATHVALVRIERVAQASDGAETIAISVRLYSPDDDAQVTLDTQVRIGGRLWAQ